MIDDNTMKQMIRIAWLLPLSLAALGCHEPQATPEQKPPMVQVSTPITGTVSDSEDFTGRTDAIYSVEVRARVTGYLDKVNFEDGIEIPENTLLFEIDPRPYQTELNRTEANVNQAEAHQKRLEADQKRAMNLFSRGAISREEIDRIGGDFAEAQAAVGVARAARDMAKLSLGFTKVTSPIAGRLSRRLVDPGNLVTADQTALTTIVSLDPLFVYFDIDERTLLKLRRLVREGKIKSRDDAVLPVQVALADEEGFPHVGNIDFSDNKVDPSTGTLRVRGKIDNPKPRVLSPGLFVRVRLPVGDPHKAVLIQEQALASDQGKKFVYVIEKGKNKKGETVDMPVRRWVTLGMLTNGLRVIEQGLKPEDKVIVNGLQRVKEKTEVRYKEVATPSLSVAADVPARAGE
jgi:membrane fusion protein, multidrug efflux system